MTVEEIEKAIDKLTPRERAHLVARLAKRDAAEWDRRIEEDAKSGRLETLFKESDEDFREGRFKPL